MWDHADWILTGTFCPHDHIEVLLDRTRAGFGWRFAVLFTADSKAHLRTLTFAAPPSGRAGRIASVIAQPLSGNARKRPITKVLRQVLLDDGEGGRFLSEEDVARVRNAFVQHSSDSKLRKALRAIEIYHLPTRGSPLHGFILGVRRDKKSREPTQRALTNLSVALNTTVQADTRRDLLVMDSVDAALGALSTADLQANPSAFADQALKLSVQITSAFCAALYRVHPNDDRDLTRVAAQGVQSCTWSEQVRAGDQVSWVLRNHRALQGVGTLIEFSHPLRSTGVAQWLLTPVPGPLGITSARPTGLLVLLRPPARGAFSAYDLALLRNIALRVAITDTTAVAARIGAAISELRSGLRPTDFLHSPAGDARDITAAAAKIEPTLVAVASATNSQSATLRLLAPHPDSSNGWCLRRICASPGSADQQSPTDHLPGGPSVNWLVLSTGEAEDIPDTSKHSYYKSHRVGTRSELCVPIKNEGRTVGVLNLESRYLSNYTPLRAQVEAFAGAVGRTLLDASLSEQRVVLDRATRALDTWHSASKPVDMLTRELEFYKDDDPAFGSMYENASRARAFLESIRHEDAAVVETAAYVLELLESAMHGAKLLDGDGDVLRDEARAHLATEGVSSYARANVEAAFHNILKNVASWSHTSPSEAQRAEAQPLIEDLGRAMVGGSPVVVLQVRNVVANRLSARQAAELYRLPARGLDGELRLGSFLAGERLRRVGGMLQASISDSGWVLVTTVAVPVQGG